MPNVHRTEVGADGVGITDALDDRNFALVVQMLYRRHGRMEAHFIVDGQYLLRCDLQDRPVVHVQGVVVRDDGVEGVEGARQLKDYQDRVFSIGSHLISFPIWVFSLSSWVGLRCRIRHLGVHLRV